MHLEKFSYNPEIQALLTKGTQEVGELIKKSYIFVDFSEYDKNGLNWTALHLFRETPIHILNHNANHQVIASLCEGDEFQVFQSVLDYPQLILEEENGFVVAAITSMKGTVYKSPGFNYPES